MSDRLAGQRRVDDPLAVLIEGASDAELLKNSVCFVRKMRKSIAGQGQVRVLEERFRRIWVARCARKRGMAMSERAGRIADVGSLASFWRLTDKSVIRCIAD